MARDEQDRKNARTVARRARERFAELDGRTEGFGTSDVLRVLHDLLGWCIHLQGMSGEPDAETNNAAAPEEAKPAESPAERPSSFNTAEKTTTRGLPVVPGIKGAPRPIDPETGQHEDYWVLSESERAKGFIRPVRRSYIHVKCGTVTTMGQAIAETYARDPKFYGATFCCNCRDHLPVGEFHWDGTEETVGS